MKLNIAANAPSGQRSIVLVMPGGDFDTGFPIYVNGTGVTGLNPDHATAGDPQFTLNLFGSNLNAATAVKFYFNGSNDTNITFGTATITSTQISVPVTVGANASIGPHEIDRKSTRLNSSHVSESRMPSSA